VILEGSLQQQDSRPQQQASVFYQQISPSNDNMEHSSYRSRPSKPKWSLTIIVDMSRSAEAVRDVLSQEASDLFANVVGFRQAFEASSRWAGKNTTYRRQYKE